MRPIPLLCALLLAFTAVPGFAQQSITLGQTVRGALEDGDPADEEGVRYDLWRFRAREARTYLVTLRSDDFDSYLRVGEGGDDWTEDDDGGGGLDAQVVFPAPRAGTYVIQVRSYAGGLGGYRLSLEDGEGMVDTVVTLPPADFDTMSFPVVVPTTDSVVAYTDTVGIALQPDEWYQGTLDGWDPQDERGAHYDELAFVGAAGQTVTITLRSADYDAFLTLGTWYNGPWQELASNDDGGGGTDSEIRITLPYEALYAVRASSLYRETTGAYELLVTSPDAWPVDTMPYPPYDTRIDPGVVDTTAAAHHVLVPYETFGGELDAGDPRGENGAFLEEWMYSGRQGERITVDLASGDFDALLSLGRYRDGAWEEVAGNDDGGGGTDSRIELTLPENDLYMVRAGALYDGATGAYTLYLASDGGDAGGVDTAAVTPLPVLAAGSPVPGELSENDQSADIRYYDLYRFHGRAGETYTITLRSGDFDAYLFVASAATGEKLASDDDGGGGRDAQVTVTLPEGGEYLVRATSVQYQEKGRYTLTLERG